MHSGVGQMLDKNEKQAEYSFHRVFGSSELLWVCGKICVSYGGSWAVGACYATGESFPHITFD